MPITVHCVRHAEGEHNLEPQDFTLLDPKLTPTGQAQCLALLNSGQIDQTRICVVAASPMFRTLETAHLVFGPALGNGHCNPQIQALADAQEVCDYPFNTGSDPLVLQARVLAANIPVDLSRVPEGWNTKPRGSRYFPARDALEARARACREQLLELGRQLEKAGVVDPEIGLVAHGGILHFVTGDWEGAGTYSGTGWRNAEARGYTLIHTIEGASGEVKLVETVGSQERRGKRLNTEVTPEQEQGQEQLFELAMEAWENQGLHSLPLTSSAE
ncbi:hypothetical protein AbraIFM66950_005027 [Aspergillus brasiliensis]|nr:hypothetical protein AbraIFM66950_005027 [Aspergillus brasiliensis]